VEKRVDRRNTGRISAAEAVDASVGPLSIRLLGPLTVLRGSTRVALPASRKLRALLAYLTLARQPVARDTLTALLWERPHDPRGELRGTLSKLRTVLDEPFRLRVRADDSGVWLDLTKDEVDALAVLRLTEAGLDRLDAQALGDVLARVQGEFLHAGEIDGSPSFNAWLVGHRRRFRALEVAALEHLHRRLPPGAPERMPTLERWLQLAPFDRHAHAALFDALAHAGRWGEGEAHLHATKRLFDSEHQDWSSIAAAWQSARQRHAPTRSATMQAEGSSEPTVRLVDATHGDVVHEPVDGRAQARALIVVMPFVELGDGAPSRGGLGDALAHDTTMRLARLRSLFVIAQGTSYTLHERRIGAEDAGRTLHVDYVASGTILRRDTSLIVQVQLAETRSVRVLWADEIRTRADDALAVLDQVGDRIVASLAHHVELAESHRSLRKPPGSLDAWEAHHRGLWHMYRFERGDNTQAQRFFETAARLDPSFSRPYAGLSFTHFQNAFLGWGDRARETDLAYRTAAQSLLADEHDPVAHWAMGRALWLRGQGSESLGELDAAVELSPNFALGHYTLAFVHSQSGDASAAIRSAERSRELSPFDPMLFGMLGARAMALMRLHRYDEAADTALKAAARPNAHVHILAIALHALVLAGRLEAGGALAAEIRNRVPGYRSDDFLRAFRFEAAMHAVLRDAGARIGMA
jgi:DNA-binding SARP family transcriptional activator/TolB-like protein